MKILFAALTTAIVIAGLVMSPVLAAPPSYTAPEYCGNTYIVQPHDSLAKIAKTCGITLLKILELNPQIRNPNLIYQGMIVRLNDSAPYTYALTPYFNKYNPSIFQNSAFSGYARVSLSATLIEAGEDVTVYVSGFPPNSNIDYRLFNRGKDTPDIFDGTVDEEGYAYQEISLPADAEVGSYWYVIVLTTSQADSVTIKSQAIRIIED